MMSFKLLRLKLRNLLSPLRIQLIAIPVGKGEWIRLNPLTDMKELLVKNEYSLIILSVSKGGNVKWVCRLHNASILTNTDRNLWVIEGLAPGSGLHDQGNVAVIAEATKRVR
jgi:hypothetical protein